MGFHFPRYFHGLRMRSSRSASSSSRTIRRRLSLPAFAREWGSNQACLIKWMIARRISFSVCIGGCNSSLSTASSPATGLNMGPPAGNGAELQFAFAPFHAPDLAGLELVFQILCGLEQRGFERVVSGLGVQGRAMNQQRSLARMAGRLGGDARARCLPPHLDAGGRVGVPLVFGGHLGGGVL